MTTELVVAGAADDGVLLTPIDAPVTVDGPAPIDTLVLSVPGGHLSWSLLSRRLVPTAILDDVDAAQDWLWAVYGEETALTVDRFAGQAVAVASDPVLPEVVTAARRLAYAHWASRWWPASAVDGIAPLDDGLLALDIAALTTACDLLVDGADAELPDPVPESARRDDYALAAGAQTSGSTPILVRGSGGWDWRNCPPGLIDASERAVSWEVRRVAGRSLVRVFAVAAPQLRGPVPAHLRPYARIGTGPAATATATALTLDGDDWTGSIAVPGAENGITVDIAVPGVGFGTDSTAEAAVREQIRRFAADRMRGVLRTGDIEPLSAETSAAAEPDL